MRFEVTHRVRCLCGGGITTLRSGGGIDVGASVSTGVEDAVVWSWIWFNPGSRLCRLDGCTGAGYRLTGEMTNYR